VSPSEETLGRRWERFVSTSDTDDRATCYNASSTGRNIFTRVAGYERLVDEPENAAPRPVVRYGYRSFDRQWAFNDPRWAKTESPSLWWSVTSKQVFMVSMMTNKLGKGPAATTSVGVPDFHYFCGRGGKDVIPLYRDAKHTPNADPKLLDLLTARHKEADAGAAGATVERLFAYALGILAGTDYTERFHEELETPGPRIPLTADPTHFNRMVAHGEKLIWLQTFGERFSDGKLPTAGIKWKSEPTRLPEAKADIAYDPETETLLVADGVLTGVPDNVWAFSVSGMEVIPKWLGYRMAKPAGKAASSKSPLDKIRPSSWLPEWSTELIEIVSSIKETLAMVPDGIALLDELVAGPLIAIDELPPVPPALRQPPKAGKGSADDDALLFEDGMLPGTQGEVIF
jgi:hypothetical protein